MKKNGSTFVSILSAGKLQSGVWNPYNYKYTDSYSTPLSDYATIKKVVGAKRHIRYFDYAPIEYKHIPKGDLVNFILEEKPKDIKGNFLFVAIDTLIFGTMRAYLGNACVTPLGNWIDKPDNFKYAINSEFVEIDPFDGFKYFWWAYVKSRSFLEELPTGSGGTRPRVSPELLENIHVNVPDENERFEINEKVKILAKSSWEIYIENKRILQKLRSKYV